MPKTLRESEEGCDVVGPALGRLLLLFTQHLGILSPRHSSQDAATGFLPSVSLRETAVP